MQKYSDVTVKQWHNAVIGVLGNSLTSAFVVQNAYLANTKSIGSSNA